MTDRDLWTIILGGMLVTYLTRLSFIVFFPMERMPALLRRGLRFVPTAVLSAIILPELFSPGGTLDVSLGNHRLIAGSLAALAAWRFRNTWVTMAVGLTTIWLLGIAAN